MKKTIAVISGIIALFAALVIGFCAWLGLFSPVAVTTVKMESLTYAYEPFTGPYHKTGPVFDSVNRKLSGIGVDALRGIGVYFDDPAATDAAKLRSECGSIIESADTAKLDEIKKILAVKETAEGEYLRAEFPIRCFLSYMAGPMKVYAAIGEEMKKKNLRSQPGIEIYDMNSKKIVYLMKAVR